MEKVAQNNAKIKVFFLITKSNFGETVWVKNAGSILQDFLRFSLKIQKVYSFCKKTVARLCLLSLERSVKVATKWTASVKTEPWRHVINTQRQ